ncbi:uncharacterized protein TRAVEDRAFT_52266 [Trametes versicolor FP-101664 SS1]|uniref:uncharacterized protein n=1 Tax=Trametes versicolor (strain FP-101664) TaxID=717944 RepID=UPI000462234F|nr:uncharacterized protein TRAVEDRAFT_52266 [Trametes versicolor FP-101664 SS1]EIW54572.1 hypothetical protein TRAVEDRAFT_52266 [Trametes versicolor FP-101664 SS1]
MLMELPNEILVLIIQAVDRDLTDLRNLALTCRALLPVTREELFSESIVNVCALLEPHIRPYSDHITKLRIEEPNSESNNVANGRFIPYLDPHALPRLTTLYFNGLNAWFFVKMPTSFYQALSSLTSVTTLALGSVYFVNFRQIQASVCSLPSLSELSLQDVGYIPWTGDMPEGYDQWAEGLPEITTRPRLSRLMIAPSSATEDVVPWLASGPSKDSLTTLVVPHRANTPQKVLSHFGPNIEHLSIHLHEYGNKTYYTRIIKGYTNLRTLRLVLDALVEAPHAWTLDVLRMLGFWIRAQHLHTIAIDVLIPCDVLERCEWQLDAQLDWDKLRLLDGVLAGPKFAVLDTVEFTVQWIGEWDPEEEMRAALAKRIEETLRKVAETRRLVTSVRGMKEVLPRAHRQGPRPEAA